MSTCLAAGGERCGGGEHLIARPEDDGTQAMDTEAPPRRAALIDDNLMFTGPIAAGLLKLGLGVETISSLGGVVERLAAAPPAVIWINLSSDRLQPLEVVRAVKAEPRLSGVPVVGYTGHTEQARIAAAREAGCDRVAANSAVTGDLRGVLSQVLSL
jgi:CheY-like chemotaxis protein